MPEPAAVFDLDPEALARFRAKFDAPNSTECWTWTAAKFAGGYGSFYVKGRGGARAHVVAYELWVGPVPRGLVLDHTCHNADLTCSGGTSCLHRLCVNPSHLEPVTRGENVRRSPVDFPLARRRRAIRACPKGHLYSGANLRVSSTGGRCCRECDRARAMARYWRDPDRHRAASRERQQRIRDAA